MEAAYAKLQKEGKNNVDNLVKWIKDCKILSVGWQKSYEILRWPILPPSTMPLINGAVGDADDFEDPSKTLEALYATYLLAKVIDPSQEERVRSYFDDVADKTNVSLEKFKEVMYKVADEFKSNFEEITKKLTKTGSKFLLDCIEGASSALTGAVKDLFKKK